MSKFRKEFGVTFPFEQNGVTGFGKSYTSIEIDTESDPMIQLEGMVKVNNIVDDVLVQITDAQLRRIQKEYVGEVVDGGPTQIDVLDVLNQVREVIHGNSDE